MLYTALYGLRHKINTNSLFRTLPRTHPENLSSFGEGKISPLRLLRRRHFKRDRTLREETAFFPSKGIKRDRTLREETAFFPSKGIKRDRTLREETAFFPSKGI